jgi:hypothetical protein
MLMVCLVLKSDLEGEYLREHGYDLILTCTFMIFVPVVAAVGVLRKLLYSTQIVMKAASTSLEIRRHQADLLFERLDKDSDGALSLLELKSGLAKIRSVTGIEMKAKQILIEADDDSNKKISKEEWFSFVTDAMAERCAELYSLSGAFERFLIGRDFVSDRELLSHYFDDVEADITSSYHVFISYRVASEKDFARKLHDELVQRSLEASGQKIRVFLDQVRLKDGERWDQAFMAGLCSSWICVPVISNGSIMPMTKLNNDSSKSEVCDNVLLEWMAAVELHSRNQIKAIMPIIVGDEGGKNFEWSLAQQLATDEHTTTADTCRQHLERERPLSSDRPSLQNAADIVQEVSAGKDTGVSVGGIVTAVLRYQGIIVPERADVRLHN